MTDSSLLVREIPLVFFFKGDSVPAYAQLSLRDAVKKWNGPVILLTNAIGFSPPSGVDLVDFSFFYRDERFSEFKEKSTLDAEFRDGFWFHTAERFFVLHQYAIRNALTRFVHLELDVIFLSSKFDPDFLDQPHRGIFYPSGSVGHSGASFFAVTNLDTLESFLQFCIDNASDGDEMALLWKFQHLGRDDVFELPSHTFFENPEVEKSETRLLPQNVGGVFDVQSFGTWLLGQDPRNIPKSPQFNRFFFEGIGSHVMSRLSFSFNLFSGRLTVREGRGARYNVVCLHIHSKNLALAVNRVRLFTVVVLAKLPFRVPLAFKNLVGYSRGRLKEQVDRVYARALRPLTARFRSR